MPQRDTCPTAKLAKPTGSTDLLEMMTPLPLTWPDGSGGVYSLGWPVTTTNGSDIRNGGMHEQLAARIRIVAGSAPELYSAHAPGTCCSPDRVAACDQLWSFLLQG